jgi:hypothetical protein
LLDTESAESAAALELADVQGHFRGPELGTEPFNNGIGAQAPNGPNPEDTRF